MTIPHFKNQNFNLEFARHCAYDVVAVDKRRTMFEHKMTFKDYSLPLLRNLEQSQLTPCGAITHTSNGKVGLRWALHQLPFSEACLATSDGEPYKDHMLGPNKPCLSLKTVPDFISTRVNYYNLSSDPLRVWGYVPDALGGKDNSDSSVRFARYINHSYPLDYHVLSSS